MKSMTLGSIFLSYLTTNTLLLFCFIILFCVLSISVYQNLYNLIYLKIIEGLATPLMHWVESFRCLCAGVVYIVLLGSPTELITLVSSLGEILTFVVLHHPLLFGEIPTQIEATRKNFWRRYQGDIINIYQVPNHKSHVLAIALFSICLSFSSPPLHLCHFIHLLFRLPFSCQIYCLLMLPCAF